MQTAYWHKRPTGYQVAVLKPKVDRLSMTFSVHDGAIRAAIRNHLATLAASGDPSIGKWKKKGGWGLGKHDRSYSLNLSNSCSILIQCAGIKPTVSLLRFEFNPNQIGRSGVTAFRKSIPKLAAGHFDYQALAEHGQVTRADIAVDLVRPTSCCLATKAATSTWD